MESVEQGFNLCHEAMFSNVSCTIVLVPCTGLVSGRILSYTGCPVIASPVLL